MKRQISVMFILYSTLIAGGYAEQTATVETVFKEMLVWVDQHALADTEQLQRTGTVYLECVERKLHHGSDEDCGSMYDAAKTALRELDDEYARVATGVSNRKCGSEVKTHIFGRRRVLYIRPGEFCLNEAQYLEERVVREVAGNGSYYGIILDLRGNPGGYMEDGYSVARKFVAKGKLGAWIDKDGLTHWRYGEAGNLVLQHAPMVLLVDGDTASAAEIVLFAVTDNGRTVGSIGSPAYGKGKYQYLQNFSAIGQVRVTGGFLLRPNKLRWDKERYIPSILIDTDVVSERDVLDIAWQLLKRHARKGYEHKTSDPEHTAASR